jgi:hypothetical protein
MTKRKIVYIVLCISTIAKIDSQEAKFGWSFGDFGWSYDFIGKNDVADGNILKFNVSFEKTNIIINTSFLFSTNKNNRESTEPFYNSFFPLEIIYSPFKWKYVHISVYGKGSWETGYTGDVADPDKISNGFYGSAGFRIGLIPMESNIFKYRSHTVIIFSEYTMRNEFKLGASIDIWNIIRLGLQLQSVEKKSTDRSEIK